MAAVFELEATTRNETGKANVRRMRRLENRVPAIIYGAGKDNEVISLDHTAVQTALKHEAFYSHILTIKVDGKAQKTVLKDLQRHPFKPKIMHMDFLRVSATEKLTMQVPLHFKGEDVAPGVKIGGGEISHLMNEVEIQCLPADLPAFIEADLSAIELNQSLHLSELTLPKGVEIVGLAEDHDLPVASIHKPTVQMIEESTAEAEGENREAKADDSADNNKDKSDKKD